MNAELQSILLYLLVIQPSSLQVSGRQETNKNTLKVSMKLMLTLISVFPHVPALIVQKLLFVHCITFFETCFYCYETESTHADDKRDNKRHCLQTQFILSEFYCVYFNIYSSAILHINHFKSEG